MHFLRTDKLFFDFLKMRQISRFFKCIVADVARLMLLERHVKIVFRVAGLDGRFGFPSERWGRRISCGLRNASVGLNCCWQWLRIQFAVMVSITLWVFGLVLAFGFFLWFSCSLGMRFGAASRWASRSFSETKVV